MPKFEFYGCGNTTRYKKGVPDYKLTDLLIYGEKKCLEYQRGYFNAYDQIRLELEKQYFATQDLTKITRYMYLGSEIDGLKEDNQLVIEAVPNCPFL